MRYLTGVVNCNNDPSEISAAILAAIKQCEDAAIHPVSVQQFDVSQCVVSGKIKTTVSVLARELSEKIERM